MFARFCRSYQMIANIVLTIFFQLIMNTSSHNITAPAKFLIFNEYIVPRVVNGRPATLTTVPYQISFKKKTTLFGGTYASFCGGTLLKASKILSAAHCFEEKSFFPPCSHTVYVSKKNREKIKAVAGYLYNKGKYSIFKTDGQWRQISKIMYPASFKFPKDDIALVFTTFKFNLDSTVNVLPYASVHKDYVGTCRISGFGRLSKTQSSTKLMYADVEVLSSSHCTSLHRMRMSKFICTSDVISDVHKGDSGGPLVCKNTGDPAEGKSGIVVGVVSGNRYMAGSFFTRVSAFKDFIESKCEMNTSSVLFTLILICMEISLFWFCFIHS